VAGTKEIETHIIAGDGYHRVAKFGFLEFGVKFLSPLGTAITHKLGQDLVELNHGLANGHLVEDFVFDGLGETSLFLYCVCVRRAHTCTQGIDTYITLPKEQNLGPLLGGKPRHPVLDVETLGNLEGGKSRRVNISDPVPEIPR